MPATPEISIIIPSYNSQGTLGACLGSIRSQSIASAIETVVVDCSDDRSSVESICREHRGIKLIRSEKKFNPGTGRNIGAAEASAPLLAFIDSDVLLEKDWAAAVLDKRALGARIFGGPIDIADEKDGVKNNIWDWASYFLDFGYYRPARKGNRIDHIPTAQMMIDRKLFSDIGGFKDRMHYEDIEYCSRLELAGFEIKFFDDVRVKHLYRGTDLRSLMRKQYIKGRYRSAFFLAPARLGIFGKMLENRSVFLFFIPAFFLYKLARTIRFNLLGADKYLARFIMILPLILLPLSAWTAGMYRECLFPAQERM